MITNNLLDKTFGPVGTFMGNVVFIAGIIAIFFSISGIILLLVGAFIGFSSTSCLIDYDKKRVKFSNNLFGIIKNGNWIDLEPDMKLGIKESHITWTAYSRTNQTLDIKNQDYRIVLYNSDQKPIMQIKKTISHDLAKIDLEKLAGQLGLVISSQPSIHL